MTGKNEFSAGKSQTPYIGSKISLVSRSEIRYEGILYRIDIENSTIALAKVQTFGTEDRPTTSPLCGSDQVYEYIIFRASDIKDLVVCETPQPAPLIIPQPIHQDPAIVAVSKQPPTLAHVHSSSPIGAGGGSPSKQEQHGRVRSLVDTPRSDESERYRSPYGQSPGYRRFTDTEENEGRSANWIWTNQRLAPSTDNSVRGVSAGRMYDGGPPPISAGHGAGNFGNFARGGQGGVPLGMPRPPQPLYKSRPFFDRVSGGDGTYESPTNLREKFHDDFDFQGANTEFKQNVESSPGVPHSASEEVVTSKPEEGSPSYQPCYDKTRSFFDSISCEILEKESKARGKFPNPNYNWRKERQINEEAFGPAAVRDYYLRQHLIQYRRQQLMQGFQGQRPPMRRY